MRPPPSPRRRTRRRRAQVRVELLARLKNGRIEPPTTLRIDTIVRSALSQGGQLLISRVDARPGPKARQRILDLVARPEAGPAATGSEGEEVDREAVEAEAADVLGQIKQAPGDVSLNSMLTEIIKLELTRRAGLPDGLLAGISPKIVKGWRDRAFAESPSHLRDHPEPVKAELAGELAALHDLLPKLPFLDIAERSGGAIRLTPLEAVAEPTNLRKLKQAITQRWGTVPLIDMLKETVLRTGCPDEVHTLAGKGALGHDELAERLMLLIYTYGTTTGVRAVAAGDHSRTEEDLRYVRRRYLPVEAARLIAAQIVNATFAAHQARLRGEGSTAVTADSTHFSAFDQNIFTEWHSRYGGRGVLIGWRPLWPRQHHALRTSTDLMR